MKKLKIIMTGAGAPGAPGIIRCYRNNRERDIEILGVDMQSRVSTIKLLDQFAQIPAASDENFCETILKLAKENDISIIQPLVTKELEVFSQNKARFENEGILICVSEQKQLEIANDKGKLLDYLKREKITVPDYRKIQKVEEFEPACQELGFPERCICFKPTKSNGSRGFRILDIRKKLSTIIFEEKPTSVYIDFNTAKQTLQQLGEIPELLIMEYMPGNEYSVDMLVENGRALYTIPRLREKMNGGISTTCTVKDEQDVIDYCNAIAASLNLHGNIGIQVRKDAAGEIKILEINPRVQGSIVACSAAGINLPYFGLKLFLKEPVPKVEIKWGSQMIRYWNEVYYDDSGHAFTY